MAARALKHYQYAQVAANTWQVVIAAIAATRAFSISKIIVSNQTSTGSVKAYMTMGPTNGGAEHILPAGNGGLIIPVNQVYTETGLVMVAGDLLRVNCDTANGVVINVFGEEVDN